MKKFCVDTSSVINGKLTQMIEDKKLDESELIIPELVLSELQAQASKGREIGYIGLEEIKKIQKLEKKHKLTINFLGERQSYEDILLAKSGRIDAMIIDVAKQNKAIFITSDRLQAIIAEVKGLKVKYFEAYEKAERIKIEDFLTDDTMSLHLKDGALPFAKRGRPGGVDFVTLRKNPMTEEELNVIATEILDAARYEDDSFVEYGEHGATVVQLKDKRVAIARPPFSDGLEITLVRPTVKLVLDDYKLSEKLKKRLDEKAEGVLLAGPPGSGKSTLAASLAEFYMKKGKIVKTMEQPRDLQVPKEITQYAPLKGKFEKTADILLLVRPDYTIFDDIRKRNEFLIFSDMRLAGIGMIGVVHATDPIDAIQRFIGKIELGMIPHVIDTILFIKDGQILKVFSLNLTVRVPTGMAEADLARPLVEVTDFENGKLEYEIYTYGEQTVIVPVKKKEISGLQKLAISKIKKEIRKFDRTAEIDFLSDNKILVKAANDKIARIIGKEGSNIKKIEEKLGMSIEVQPQVESMGKEIGFEINETGGYIVLSFSKKLSGRNASVYINKEYLFSATIGRTGQIKVSKSSDLGKSLLRTVTTKKDIKVFI
ncbi:MAG: Flp pilus assembly complex ATPase component TadA [Candidatus Aenigmarchaeota archaeon]|nr:Flp pilus assembly complex ATPase component TadA [Candidatus Aenigmarchaeota archaeon]